MKNFYIFLLFLMLLLVNCATTNDKAKINPFKQYYTGHQAPKQADLSQDSVSSSGPKLYVGNINSYLEDINLMEEVGYSFLGFSCFDGVKVELDEAVLFGKEIGADFVLVYSSYSNTISGTLPLTLPSTKTETTTKTGNITDFGNIYGTDENAGYPGNIRYSEKATKVTQDYKTTYFPYSIDRYNYIAVYWTKLKGYLILGVTFTDLPLEIRKKIGSNKGVIVTTVVNGSPAFMADILEDDIIRKANSIEIIDAGSLHSFLDIYEGERVKFEIIRGNKTIIKDVQLNEKK